MTSIAQPPAAETGAQRTVERVNHWINGRRVAGTLRAQRAGLQPGHRRAGARGRLRIGRGGRRRGRGRQGGLPRAGARRASASGPRSCSGSATWSTQHRAEIAAHLTRRARQGAERRPGRGGPRPREPRVRDRHPAPAQGRLQRAGQHAASTSTRSASRSAWWPASRPSTSRPWCRCGCSATPSPAATRSS